jgi:hypothetical protein
VPLTFIHDHCAGSDKERGFYLLPKGIQLPMTGNSPVLGNSVACMVELPGMDNKVAAGNKILGRAIRELARQIPPGWRIRSSSGRRARIREAVVELAAPNGAVARWIVREKRRVDPKDIPSLLADLGRNQGRLPLLVSPFLSPRTRERLAAANVSYVDLTGNIRVLATRPGLFILSQGADANPWPEPGGRRSLKGPKAGRIVRALCDFLPPLGVRVLAQRTRTDAGYCSRVLDLLEREDLLKRTRRGPVIAVEWQALIRRWVQDYSAFDPARTRSYLAPRGLSVILDTLGRSRFRYAVTGAFVASRVAAVAPPRLLACYVNDPDGAAARLDLRRTETGANVLLTVPFDPVVYERMSTQNGLRMAAASQVAADLLTSPGRGPQEAEEYMNWMRENERVWRS